MSNTLDQLKEMDRFIKNINKSHEITITPTRGENILRTTTLPKYNCSNCSHFIKSPQVAFHIKGDIWLDSCYVMECSNVSHPITDCILRGFEAHSDQPGFSQTLNIENYGDK